MLSNNSRLLKLTPIYLLSSDFVQLPKCIFIKAFKFWIIKIIDGNEKFDKNRNTKKFSPTIHIIVI